MNDMLLEQMIYKAFENAPERQIPLRELMLHLVEQGRYAELLNLVEKLGEAYGEADNR